MTIKATNNYYKITKPITILKKALTGNIKYINKVHLYKYINNTNIHPSILKKYTSQPIQLESSIPDQYILTGNSFTPTNNQIECSVSEHLANTLHLKINDRLKIKINRFTVNFIISSIHNTNLSTPYQHVIAEFEPLKSTNYRWFGSIETNQPSELVTIAKKAYPYQTIQNNHIMNQTTQHIIESTNGYIQLFAVLIIIQLLTTIFIHQQFNKN